MRSRTAVPRMAQQTAQDTTSSHKMRNQNTVQVCVRVAPQRGPSSSASCIKAEPFHSKEVLVCPPSHAINSSIPNNATLLPLNATALHYDHVYGENCDQSLIANETLLPLLQDIINGFSACIFCYGPTGCGKTYTMEGDLTPSLNNYSPNAGLIPRTLYKLFSQLEQHNCTEFSVRVSYLELYNEELRDLNALGSTSRPELKLFDDNVRKGVVVQGMEETLIKSPQDGIKVLARGAERRQVASTKCNDRSSRSHTIFSITVHLKEQASLSGSNGSSKSSEDLLKVGKISLVDLAGSENIARSGAKNSRAREAGAINQSLLTLGRVINALVEKSNHIPYRESKLTRLLQDSLGGRTKTCIIACVSQSAETFEETLSTLEYASRARSITNTPQPNARMTRTALLNAYGVEIERLKADLVAAREQCGIYLSDESWNDLATEHEARRIGLEESKKQCDVLEMQLRTMSEQFEHSLSLLKNKEEEITSLSYERELIASEVDALKTSLTNQTERLESETRRKEAEQRSKKEWQNWAQTAVTDTNGLREKIARKSAIEASNNNTLHQATKALSYTAQSMRSLFSTFHADQTACLSGISNALSDMTLQKKEKDSRLHTAISEQLANLLSASRQTAEATSQTDTALSQIEDMIEVAAESIMRILRSGCDDVQASQLTMKQTIMAQFELTSNAALKTFESMAEQAAAIEIKATAHKELFQSAIHEQLEYEKRILEADNARLEEQVKSLQATIARQEFQTATFTQTLMQTIQDQLTAFQTSQTSSLQHSLVPIQQQISLDREERRSHARQRTQSLNGIQNQHASVVKCYAEALEDAQDAALDQVRIQKAGQVSAKRILAEDDTEENLYGLISSIQHVTNELQLDAEAYQYDLEQGLGQERALATTSYADGQRLLETLEEEVSETSRFEEKIMSDVHDQLDSLSFGSKTFHSTLSGHVESLSNYADTYLSSGQGSLLLQDVPTGHTPRKRQWPSFTDEEEDEEPSIIQHQQQQSSAPIRKSSSTNKPLANHSHVSKKSTAFKVLADNTNKLTALDAVVTSDVLKGRS